MLDPASIERLAEFPEQNDPLLNVALAEEGGGAVLIAMRVTREGDSLTVADEGEVAPLAFQIEARLIGHPNAPAAVRDLVLGRHPHDPFFVLSAAAHREATPLALESAADWPSASPLHDRRWLRLLSGTARYPELVMRWADGGELLREAAACLTADAELLGRLAGDRSRRVRRAVLSNARAGEVRERLARSDAAVEVRARAAKLPSAEVDGGSNAGFDAALLEMREGGVLATDVRRALLGAGTTLDEEGAFLAARHLARDELCTLISQATGQDADPFGPRTLGVGVGFGLRSSTTTDAMTGDDALLTSDIVHLVTKRASAETRLTGKARVARWISDCLGRAQAVDPAELPRMLGPGTLASDRMVLRRWASEAKASLSGVCTLDAHAVPAAVVEICWRDPKVSDEAVVALAGKIAPSTRLERELPEDDLDLSPLGRPLAVLERAVLSAIARTSVSPRAALAAIALEPRRCRYVLAAMPMWKGTLTGARLARVLRSHAGALSALQRPTHGAPSPSGPRPASVARWTDRRLTEAEAAIAIAVGDLTAGELLRRIASGAIKLEEGVMLAAGIEARVAIDGPAGFIPLLDHASSRRTQDAAALALWMLLEDLDRVRASSLIASAIDGLSVSGSVVPPAVCEALATLERRSPGRLENVHAQSPRGRATVASAIARAYRAFGGTRDEA
jgi:hypothetical protein